jgi:hypothetical protein
MPQQEYKSMSTNPFQAYAQFAYQICEDESKRDRSPNRLYRLRGEMHQHVSQRQTELYRLRTAALAAGPKTGHKQDEVERRVVELFDLCVKLLRWECDAPRLSLEGIRERESVVLDEDDEDELEDDLPQEELLQLEDGLSREEHRQRHLPGCWEGDPAGDYFTGLSNQFLPLWQRVNDLAAAYDGAAAEEPPDKKTANSTPAHENHVTPDASSEPADETDIETTKGGAGEGRKKSRINPKNWAIAHDGKDWHVYHHEPSRGRWERGKRLNLRAKGSKQHYLLRLFIAKGGQLPLVDALALWKNRLARGDTPRKVRDCLDPEISALRKLIRKAIKAEDSFEVFRRDDSDGNTVWIPQIKIGIAERKDSERADDQDTWRIRAAEELSEDERLDYLPERKGRVGK